MDSIQFKRSNVAGKKPTTSALKVGELALNTADKQLFTKDADGNLVEFIDHQSVEQQFAMKKTQFEALRQANRDKYAGSGFVHWGQNSSKNINQGMHVHDEFLFLGRENSGTNVGESKTLHPLVNVDGVLHHLGGLVGEGNTFADTRIDIIFPPAPAGYETYNKSDGSYINHLTAKSYKYKDANGNPTDAGGDTNEACSRAFEGGSITNGDFRKGDDSWAISNTSDGFAQIADNSLTMLTGSKPHDLLVSAKPITIEIGDQFVIEVDYKYKEGVDLNAGEGFYVELTGLLGSVMLPPTQKTARFLTPVSEVRVGGTLRFRGWSRIGMEINITNVRFHRINESVITSRQDLAYLETWFERVDKYDLVQPFGNSQFGGSTFSDKSLTDISTIEYETGTTIGKGYAKFGAWQSDDDVTTTYGLQWSTLTDAEKLVYLQDPVHNLYWDEDEQALVQAKYRIKTIAGYGNSWDFISLHNNQETIYNPVYYSTGNRLQFQGNSDTTFGFDGDNVYNFRRGVMTSTTEKQLQKGLYTASSYNATDLPTDRSVNGEGYAIMLALVQRLNQGAYSPLNPMGCSRVVSESGGIAKLWYESDARKIDNLKKCFIRPSEFVYPFVDGYLYLDSQANPSGCIYGDMVGRPDFDPYEYYDAIYEGQVLDLRLNANKLDVSRLREDAMRKAVAGEVRGWESLPVLMGFDSADADGTVSTTIYSANFVGYTFYKNTRLFLQREDGSWEHYPDAVPTLRYNNSAITWSEPITRTSGKYYLSVESTEKFNALPMTDIIGDPANIKATMDALGVDKLVGAWIPELPEATSKYVDRTRKATSKGKRHLTKDKGVTWTRHSDGHSDTKNHCYVEPNVDAVQFMTYSSLSNFTESASSTALAGEVGDVFTTNGHYIDLGNRLQPSLINKVGKNSASSSVASWGSMHLTAHKLLTDKRLNHYDGQIGYPKHAEFALNQPNNYTHAVKALSTLVEKNGLWYLQLHGCELMWSSDLGATTVTSSTFSDWVLNETYFIQVPNTTIPQGVYKYVTTTTANVFDYIWTVSPNNDLVSTGGLVYFKWVASSDLGSWGDDQTIPIVNNESTKTDDNGNTVKTFCHHTMQPLGIAYTD